jgi:hypothetical protein
MKEYTKQWLQFLLSWMFIIAVFMGIVGLVFSIYSISGTQKNQSVISNIPEVHDVAKIPVPENATKIANGVYRLSNGSLMGCMDSTHCEIFDMERFKRIA